MSRTLYIISGPSGAGKGTIVKEILARRPEIKLAVSATTRPARSMERNGVDYHFISEREFKSMRDRGEFLEWAEVHGNFYGTPKQQIDEHLAEGSDVILEIDVQGAAQVKGRMPDAGLIFIEAPSIEILHRRLSERGTEPSEEVSRRVADAYDEIRQKHQFDGVVVNVDLPVAVQEVLLLMDQIKEKA